jgi:hypothetical protein
MSINNQKTLAVACASGSFKGALQLVQSRGFEQLLWDCCIK